MKNSKASVLVVEDDPPILKGLLDVLVFNGFSAKGAADGAEGLAAATQDPVDLVILDVMLPTMDGCAVCREIRSRKPHLPVIMLTAKGSEEDILAGFRAGADDYVSKPFSIRELLVRVEALLRRSGKSMGDEKISLAGILFDGTLLTASKDGMVQEITRREMDIIIYLVQQPERIVSKKELLSRVWGYGDTDIETRTVDIHIQKLRKKISSLTHGAPIIITMRGEGYRLEEPR